MLIMDLFSILAYHTACGGGLPHRPRRLGQGVLAALVPGKCKACCRSIPTARHVTGVGTLARVNAHVHRDLAALRCSIPTARHVTGIGALARVDAHVPLQMRCLFRRVPAPRVRALLDAWHDSTFRCTTLNSSACAYRPLAAPKPHTTRTSRSTSTLLVPASDALSSCPRAGAPQHGSQIAALPHPVAGDETW